MSRFLKFLFALVSGAVLILLLCINRHPQGPPRAVAGPDSAPAPAAPPRIPVFIPQTATGFPPSEPPAAAAKADPTVVVLALLREWDGNDDSAARAQRLQELDGLLSGSNAWQIVQTLPPEFMGYAFAAPSFHARLLADPQATMDWMVAHTNVFNSQSQSFLRDWEQKDDGGGLFQYAMAMPDGEAREKIIAAAGDAMLSSDPLSTITWANYLDAGPTRDRLLQMAAASWASQDPVSAAEWVGQVDDPGLRNQLAGSFAVSYAGTDPAHAADWLAQSVSPGQTLDRSAADIVWNWAMTDPVSASSWVQDFPEGTARQMALANLVNVWGNHDRPALENWIASLTDDSLRAQAATLFAQLPEKSAP